MPLTKEGAAPPPPTPTIYFCPFATDHEVARGGGFSYISLSSSYIEKIIHKCVEMTFLFSQIFEYIELNTRREIFHISKQPCIILFII